jgi:hypothetical protein
MSASGAGERWFDLNGALLHLSAPDSALIDPLLPYLDPLSVPPAPDAKAFHIVLERGTPSAVPADARLLYDGPLPEGTPCRISLDGDGRRWVVVPERLSLHFSAARRQGRLQVLPGAEAVVGGSAGILAIDAVLMASQQILVHAAVLRLPSREAAFALLAPSGAGKTTTSLALALRGFAFMTDDAAVLMPGPTAAASANPPSLAPRIWGLPRALKVHRRTAQMLPRIGGLLSGAWNAEDEQPIARAALRTVIDVAPLRPVPLAAFVLLGPRVQGRHRLGPVSKPDLLAAVAADNIFCSRQGVLEDDLSRYRMLAGTVMALPALELNVGSELDTLPACVLDAFG